MESRCGFHDGIACKRQTLGLCSQHYHFQLKHDCCSQWPNVPCREAQLYVRKRSNDSKQMAWEAQSQQYCCTSCFTFHPVRDTRQPQIRCKKEITFTRMNFDVAHQRQWDERCQKKTERGVGTTALYTEKHNSEFILYEQFHTVPSTRENPE